MVSLVSFEYFPSYVCAYPGVDSGAGVLHVELTSEAGEVNLLKEELVSADRPRRSMVAECQCEVRYA